MINDLVFLAAHQLAQAIRDRKIISLLKMIEKGKDVFKFERVD